MQVFLEGGSKINFPSKVDGVGFISQNVRLIQGEEPYMTTIKIVTQFYL
jgi:hypothetical protein